MTLHVNPFGEVVCVCVESLYLVTASATLLLVNCSVPFVSRSCGSIQVELPQTEYDLVPTKCMQSLLQRQTGNSGLVISCFVT